MIIGPKMRTHTYQGPSKVIMTMRDGRIFEKYFDSYWLATLFIHLIPYDQVHSKKGSFVRQIARAKVSPTLQLEN